MMRCMREDKSQDGHPLYQDGSRHRLVDKEDMGDNESRDRHVDRMSVPEAAELLGITQSAVRKRVQRGTIPWDKDNEGRIYVYVDLYEPRPETVRVKPRNAATGQSQDELLEAYRDQVEFLRRELERKDTLLMSLMQRIPELEAPSVTRDTSETPPEDLGENSVPPKPEDPVSRRSWWRSFFGID
jgi:hypothetical protein